MQEDKLFFKNILQSKNYEYSKQTIFEINYFIQVNIFLNQRINQLRADEVIQFFGIRKPRSTRKNFKENGELESYGKCNDDDYKYDLVFLKIFNHKINFNLLQRYFKAHDITEIYYSLNYNLMRNDLYINYFTAIKDFEDLGNFFSY